MFRAIAAAVLLLGATTLTMSFAPLGSVPVEAAAGPAVDAAAEPQVALRLSFDDSEAAPPMDDTAFDGTSAFGDEVAMSTRLLVNRWNPLIEEASLRFGVPKTWIRAVLTRESGGHTVNARGKPIRSRAGAQGLMQLMPGTYDDLRRQYGLGANPYDPHDNVIAGAAYLKWLKERYGYPGLFAAYNHGPGNFERHLQGKSALPRETRDYLAAITASLHRTATEPVFASRKKVRKPVALRLATL